MAVRSLLALTVVVIGTSCNSSTSPSTGGGGGPPTHPAGVVDTLAFFGRNPHGIAISSRGVIVATLIDLDTVVFAADSPFRWGPLLTASRIPVDVSISPDGNTAYVANEGRFEITTYDLRTGTRGDSIRVPPSSGVNRVLVNQLGTRLYVTDGTDLGGAATGHVYVFDLPSRALVDSIPVPGSTNGITFDSAANRLYVSSTGGTVTEIDAGTDGVLRSLYGGVVPEDIAISPDHTELWVADGGPGVRVFDLATGDSIATIPGTAKAFGLKITPDGTQVYATIWSTNHWVVIDRASRTVIRDTPAVIAPFRIAFNATGSIAAITDGGRIDVVR